MSCLKRLFRALLRELSVQTALRRFKISTSDAYFFVSEMTADFFNRIGQKPTFGASRINPSSPVLLAFRSTLHAYADGADVSKPKQRYLPNRLLFGHMCNLCVRPALGQSLTVPMHPTAGDQYKRPVRYQANQPNQQHTDKHVAGSEEVGGIAGKNPCRPTHLSTSPTRL